LGGTDEDSRPSAAQRDNFVLPDFGPPLVVKAHVIPNSRKIVATSDDSARTSRHSAPGLQDAAWVNVMLVYEQLEQRKGFLIAQADALTYTRDLSIGVHAVPSALALVDSSEHRFALIISKVSSLHTISFGRLFLAKEGYQKTGLY